MSQFEYQIVGNGEQSDLFDGMELGFPDDAEELKEAFREALFAAQGAVENALLGRWAKDDDFEVGWDFDYRYWLHGGIYSEQIFCPLYITTIIDALDKTPNSDKWAYNTVSEIIVNPDGKTMAESTEDWGEFTIRNRKLYIYEDEMKPDKIRRLIGE